MLRMSFAEARLSGRFVEKEIQGVVFTHAGKSNSWIDGHAKASKLEIQDRCNRKRLKFLMAQIYWWTIPLDIVWDELEKEWKKKFEPPSIPPKNDDRIIAETEIIWRQHARPSKRHFIIIEDQSDKENPTNCADNRPYVGVKGPAVPAAREEKVTEKLYRAAAAADEHMKALQDEITKLKAELLVEKETSQRLRKLEYPPH